MSAISTIKPIVRPSIWGVILWSSDSRSVILCLAFSVNVRSHRARLTLTAFGSFLLWTSIGKMILICVGMRTSEIAFFILGGRHPFKFLQNGGCICLLLFRIGDFCRNFGWQSVPECFFKALHKGWKDWPKYGPKYCHIWYQIWGVPIGY